MDDKTKILLEAGRLMVALLAKDPGGVEMATGAYTEREAEDAIAAWRRADAAIDPDALGLHGFDLTDFGANGWQAVCRELGLTFDGRARHHQRPAELQGWGWRSVATGLLIVTAVNPDTGEHYAAMKSDFYKDASEPGYASYMGVQGPAVAVQKAVAVIRQHAEYIKGEDAGRRSYI